VQHGLGASQAIYGTPAPYLVALNAEQRRAVAHGCTDLEQVPPLLIIAGAGSGKTNRARRVEALCCGACLKVDPVLTAPNLQLTRKEAPARWARASLLNRGSDIIPTAPINRARPCEL